MIEIRKFKPEEYSLLEGVSRLNTENSIIIGAFDGDRLVGRMALLNLPHLEGAWIDPEYRGGTLLKRLEHKAINTLKEFGASKILAIAISEKIEEYLNRMDYARLGTIWDKEI